MSNFLFMDESNGNGVYASKTITTPAGAATTAHSNTSNNTATAATTTNNINIIMSATTTAAAAAAAALPLTLPTSVSNEDLSQSLSEYTDADESISAPTEFLAEFLSAVMLKDYKKALKYCKLILQYEPHNSTAKEFYPLILDKLRGATTSDSDENYNKSSSSPEMALELQSSDPSGGESDEADDLQVEGAMEDGCDDGYDMPEDNSACDSLSDESVDCEVDEDDEEEEDDIEDVEEEDVISSSGDDLPIDDQQDCADECGVGMAGNNSHSSRNSSSGGESRSRSDNTTHSYSSLLLEEEDDIVPVHLQFSKELPSPDLDVSNGNKIPSTSCSDSESPTEPLTQRLAAILRSKCGISSSDDHY